MALKISNRLVDDNPSAEILRWSKQNLVLDNPQKIKAERMGHWTGNIPSKLYLYEMDGGKLVLPFGVLREVLPFYELREASSSFVEHPVISVPVDGLGLYEYQAEAVDKMLSARYGILQAPAGSGKTQMGIAIAVTRRRKTLWLTHTIDLLEQSYNRARQFIDEKYLGKITAGRAQLGEFMTFATIQTLSKMDLSLYKDTFDTVIVDECHRVAGTPTAVTQFSKVLNALAAPHKYGLSATVHRSDGMIRATTALLGQVVYEVPKSAVADKICPVYIQKVETDYFPSDSALNFDGTINYANLINDLSSSDERNKLICDILSKMKPTDSALVLSSRVGQLYDLYDALPEWVKQDAAVIDGKMVSKTAKALRSQYIDEMRSGKKTILFATYQLAKEGLDIPCLNKLILATPEKDFAVITQSVGRVARCFDGKTHGVVYDLVDKSKYCINAFKKRCRIYREGGYTIVTDN